MPRRALLRLATNIGGIIATRALGAVYFFVVSGFVARQMSPGELSYLLSFVAVSTLISFLQLGLGSSVIRAVASDPDWAGRSDVRSMTTAVKATSGVTAVGLALFLAWGPGADAKYATLLALLSCITAVCQSAEWVLAGESKNRITAGAYIAAYVILLALAVLVPPRSAGYAFLLLYAAPPLGSLFTYALLNVISPAFRRLQLTVASPRLEHIMEAFGPGFLFTVAASLVNTVPQSTNLLRAHTASPDVALLRLIYSVTTVLASAAGPMVIETLKASRNGITSATRLMIMGLSAFGVAAFAFTFLAAPMALKLWLGAKVATPGEVTRLLAAITAATWFPSSVMLQLEFMMASRWKAALALTAGALIAGACLGVQALRIGDVSPLTAQVLVTFGTIAALIAMQRRLTANSDRQTSA